jgi:hypothetical protein
MFLSSFSSPVQAEVEVAPSRDLQRWAIDHVRAQLSAPSSPLEQARLRHQLCDLYTQPLSRVR